MPRRRGTKAPARPPASNSSPPPPADAPDAVEPDAALRAALLRSMDEQTLADSELGDAMRASLLTHDEELARAIQRDLQLDETPRPLLASEPAAPATDTWTVVAKRGRHPPPAAKPRAARVAAFGSGAAGPSAAVAAALPAAGGPGEVVVSRGLSVADVLPERAGGLPLHAVLDGLNVGCGFGGGGGRFFRARGVQLALLYFAKAGQRALALLPENKVNPASAECARPEEVALLRRLEADGLVAFLPARVNDDLFILRVAMDRRAFLVSNDQFRKEIVKQTGRDNTRSVKRFLAEFLVPFCFIDGRFYPSPKQDEIAVMGSYQPVRRF